MIKARLPVDCILAGDIYRSMAYREFHFIDLFGDIGQILIP